MIKGGKKGRKFLDGTKSMTKRTLDHTGRDEMTKRKPKLTPEQQELIDLRLRWFRKTAEYMPVDIQALPLDAIRRAVEVTGDDSDGSLREWDCESNG